MAETNFVEARILLAVIRDDFEEAFEEAQSLTTHEIHQLRVRLGEMDHVLKEMWKLKIGKGEPNGRDGP